MGMGRGVLQRLRSLRKKLIAASTMNLTAPPLDFSIVEDLTNHAAKQTLEAGVVELSNRSDGFLLVGLQQALGSVQCLELAAKAFNILMGNRAIELPFPGRLQGVAIGSLGFFVSHGQRQVGANLFQKTY